jgi:LacI family transcriptional regulator, galactose operon repressor
VPDRSTIYEVAKRSGVSTATVSRVMVDGKGFSKQTRERVLAAASDLGWVPSGSARGLASRRAGIVGLLFPDLGQSGAAEEESPLYVDQVIRGAERAATAAGDAVLIAATHSESGRELAFSVAGKVDGLVVMARSLSDDDIAAISRSVPVVILATSRVDGEVGFVGADNTGGSRQITEHLLAVHGHTDLAFIGGPADSPDSEERFAGFCEALRQAGLAVPGEPAAMGEFTEAGGKKAVQAMLAGGRPPHAIVCGNDEMAIGALAALRSSRLRVPGDVAVTGFDDIAATRHVRPALSTVRQPMRELGERSVRMLLHRIADPAAAQNSVVLPTEIVIRASCGCRARATAQRSAVASERNPS